MGIAAPEHTYCAWICNSWTEILKLTLPSLSGCLPLHNDLMDYALIMRRRRPRLLHRQGKLLQCNPGLSSRKMSLLHNYKKQIRHTINYSIHMTKLIDSKMLVYTPPGSGKTITTWSLLPLGNALHIQIDYAQSMKYRLLYPQNNQSSTTEW